MKLVLSTVLIGALVVACSNQSSSPDSPTNRGDDQKNKPAGQLDAAALTGRWISPCLDSVAGVFRVGAKLMRQFDFSGDKIVITTAAYKNDCTKENLDRVQITTLSFKMGDSAANSEIPGNQIDFNVSEVQLLAVTQESVSYMNTDKGTCGLKNWTIGVARSVKDIPGCDYFYAAGIVPFDTVAKVDDKLLLGAYYESETVGRESNARPHRWARNEELTKTTDSLPGVSANKSKSSALLKEVSIPSESTDLLQFSDIWRGNGYGTWNHTPATVYPNINFQFFEDPIDHKLGFFRSYEVGLSNEFNGGFMTFKALSSTQAQLSLDIQYNFGSNRPVYDWNVNDHISCLIEVTKSSQKTMKALCNKGNIFPTSVADGLVYRYID